MTPQEMYPELSPEAALDAMRLNAARAGLAPPGPPVPGQVPPPPAPPPPGGLVPPVPQPLSPSSYTVSPMHPSVASGTPVPLPGGEQPAATGGSPLDALREQMGVVNQLVGRSPQAPYINHMLNSGSPTAGLMSLNGRHGGGMVGSQDQGGVTVDPAAALQTSIYNTQEAGRGHDQQMLLNRLGAMGDQALRGGALNLDTIRTLGAPGIQGQMARDNQLAQSSIDANGLNRQHDAQRAAAYNTFIQQRVLNGASITDAAREWRESGQSIPAFAGGPPVTSPTPPPPVTSPTPPPPVGEQSPTSRMEQIYRSIQQRQSGAGPQQGGQARITDPRAGITDMVHGLGENFVNQNAPQVMQFIIDRFGADAANQWFTARSSVLGRQTPQEEAIQMIQRAANARSPGLVGNNRVNPQTSGPSSVAPYLPFLRNIQ